MMTFVWRGWAGRHQGAAWPAARHITSSAQVALPSCPQVPPAPLPAGSPPGAVDGPAAAALPGAPGRSFASLSRSSVSWITCRRSRQTGTRHTHARHGSHLVWSHPQVQPCAVYPTRPSPASLSHTRRLHLGSR